MAKKAFELEPYLLEEPNLSDIREYSFSQNRYKLCKLLALPEDAAFSDFLATWEKLSAMEKGNFFCTALDFGYWSSMRKLAEEMGVLRHKDMEWNAIYAYIKVARLPNQVKGAFRVQRSIKLLWAKRISLALARDPDLVLARSREISASRARGERVTDAMAYKSLVAP